MGKVTGRVHAVVPGRRGSVCAVSQNDSNSHIHLAASQDTDIYVTFDRRDYGPTSRAPRVARVNAAGRQVAFQNPGYRALDRRVMDSVTYATNKLKLASSYSWKPVYDLSYGLNGKTIV